MFCGVLRFLGSLSRDQTFVKVVMVWYIVGGSTVGCSCTADRVAQAGEILMDTFGLLQILLYLVVLLALVKPLGWYMARVYEGKPIGLDRVLEPVERLIYRLCDVDPRREVGWKRYALGALAFNAAGFTFLYVLQRVQQFLPLNPEHLAAVKTHTAQHGRELCHEHELAIPRRRDHDELSDADARHDRAELRLGRDRHGSADRDDLGLCPAATARRSATSGSI
jgi:hypothetical protein